MEIAFFNKTCISIACKELHYGTFTLKSEIPGGTTRLSFVRIRIDEKELNTTQITA